MLFHGDIGSLAAAWAHLVIQPGLKEEVVTLYLEGQGKRVWLSIRQAPRRYLHQAPHVRKDERQQAGTATAGPRMRPRNHTERTYRLAVVFPHTLRAPQQ